MKFSTRICAATAFLGIAITPAFAGREVVSKQTVEETSPFDKGRLEIQLGATYFHSLQSGDLTPEVNDVGGLARIGWMLGDVSGDGWCRGNWEFLLEAQASAITHGPGDIIAGGSFLFRYNFVQPGTRWVPYFQLGGGGSYSDMHEDLSQTLIGREWSFNLLGGFGIRYLCSDQCALFFELMYRHISNADTADRNTGLDSLGGVVGVSWFF